jgi:hypothetical protein
MLEPAELVANTRITNPAMVVLIIDGHTIQSRASEILYTLSNCNQYSVIGNQYYVIYQTLTDY